LGFLARKTESFGCILWLMKLTRLISAKVNVTVAVSMAYS
jgi:hypothetical protein